MFTHIRQPPSTAQYDYVWLLQCSPEFVQITPDPVHHNQQLFTLKQLQNQLNQYTYIV